MRVRALVPVVAVLLVAGCALGAKSVDRAAYVEENLDAVVFLQHPSEDRTLRHQPQRALVGEEEVVVAYVTIMEEPRPPDFDPFTYFAEQFAAQGWSVGCIETELSGGAMARSVSAANDTSFARVEASESVILVSVDHKGAGSGNGTAQDLAWNCAIPPP